MTLAASQSGVDRERVRRLENAEDARFAAEHPRSAALMARGREVMLIGVPNVLRVWLVNRGVWEAIVGAGPVCAAPAADEDVDAYLSGWDSLVDALTA